MWDDVDVVVCGGLRIFRFIGGKHGMNFNVVVAVWGVVCYVVGILTERHLDKKVND